MSEARCEQCKYYIKLGIPYCYKQKGYKNGVTVYGFCAKDVERLFSFYPVYLPNGGVCKAFQKICERPKCGSEGLIEKSTSKRDILFRGKRLDNGEWVYGTPFFGTSDSCKMICAVALHPDFVDEGNVHHSEGFSVDPATVGQYTGMITKDGVKIFEGDIVSDDSIHMIGSVVLERGRFGIDDIYDDFQDWEYWENLEVIGNMYDNPELLEEEENTDV